MNRRTILRIATAVLVAVAIVFFALALRETWREVGRWPSPLSLAATSGLWMVGLGVASSGWAYLLGPPHLTRHSAAFLVSQIGKYVPGGIGQAAGQVGLARSSGVSVRRGVVTLGVFAIVQGGAGAASLIVLGIVWDDPSVLVRTGLVMAGLTGVVLALERRWMIWLLGKIRRLSESAADIPGSRPILGAWCSLVVSVSSAAIGYAVILSGLVPVDDPVLVAVGFAAAWTAGFLAVPLPSGLGVRELALVAVLGTAGYSTAVLVAASAIHRLVLMLTEAAVAGGATVVLHRLRVPTPFEAAEDPSPQATEP